MEKVLLVGVGFEEGYTCSCVVELDLDTDNPVEVFLSEKGLDIRNVDEVLVIRNGFKVKQIRVT